MKRILLISREFPPSLGGAGIAVYNYIKNIKSYKFFVLSFFDTTFSNENITVKKLNNPFYGHRYTSAFLFVFSSILNSMRNFDCIVGNAFIGGAVGVIVKWLTRKPLISIIHDIDYVYGPLCKYNILNKLIRQFFFKLIISNSNAIIVPNALIKDDIVKIFGKGIGKKVEIITLGVDMEPFKKMKKPRGKYIVLCVATIRKNKGIEYLIEAFKTVLHEVRNSELWIAGSAPERDYYIMLKKLVKKYRIGKNVKFLGPVKHYGKKNIFSYYDICDIFSIASYHSEKFGMPCVEASLMGKPIVATDVFEENGVVVNGKTALVVPTRNSDELAKALIELLKDKKLRERLGKNARKFAERFKTINLSKEFEAVLKSNI